MNFYMRHNYTDECTYSFDGYSFFEADSEEEAFVKICEIVEAEIQRLHEDFGDEWLKYIHRMDIKFLGEEVPIYEFIDVEFEENWKKNPRANRPYVKGYSINPKFYPLESLVQTKL